MAFDIRDNTALIGMPGSGKTVIGQMLSEKLGLGFVNMDDYIEKQSGKNIAQLFEAGEDRFREWETRACGELSQKSGLVISCGGGVVKKAENIALLKRSCIVVFLNRPLKNIQKDIHIASRPLLKDGKGRLAALYRERIGLYRAAADMEILNDGPLSDVVSRLAEALKARMPADFRQTSVTNFTE